MINQQIIEILPKSQRLEKLGKQLESQVGKAIVDYQMIAEGDVVLVCVSGGKDSYTLLDILLKLQKKAPINFNIIAMNLDQKQPGFPSEVLPTYLSKIGVNYKIVEADTYSIVKEKIPEGKTTCSLCSRLRRGIIYKTAKELGANKIALGHHQDDMVHTLFLNLFFAGKIKAMPPKYLTDDEEHIVIRPLAYCAESDISRYARGMDFPIIPCNLCGSQENLQRKKVREMVNEWDKRFPGRIQAIFTALQNVVPSHLADTNFFDFTTIQIKQNNLDNSQNLNAQDLANNEFSKKPKEFFAKGRINKKSIDKQLSSEISENNKFDRAIVASENLTVNQTTTNISKVKNSEVNVSQAAVLFADIVHSSYLYVELGDSEAMKVISQCQNIMLSTVETFHAQRTKTLGDGVLVIFSTSEEALRAGIAIQRLLNTLIFPSNIEIEIRIGIHFGQVISDERDIYGDALNITARLMENAKPKSILCSWQAVNLAENYTKALAKDQGVIWVKGRAEQINVFQLNWHNDDKENFTISLNSKVPTIPEKRLILAQNLLHSYVDQFYPVLLIGSSSDCDFQIKNPGIDSHHARIEYRSGELYFIDQSFFGSIITRPGQPAVIVRHDELNLSADGKIFLCCNDNLINFLQKNKSNVVSEENYLAEDVSLLSFHIIDTEKL